MKRSLLLSAWLVASLLVYAPVYAQGTAYFWAGGSFEGEVWRDTVVAVPNQWIDIPIYHQSDPDVYIESIFYVLGCKQALIDTIDVNGGHMFYPLTEWDTAEFLPLLYNYDTHPTHPNPPGYISLPFCGFARQVNPDSPLLHFEIPTHILTYRVHAVDNSYLINTTHCDAMIAGMAPVGGPSNCGDSTGSVSYPMDMSFACVRFIEGYKYLPGDVNMAVGAWPPQAIVGDVTYLVNYFGSFPGIQTCLLDGFWASADANGDCQIIASDVTKLINYLRGQTDLSCCPNYPPSWFTQADLPAEAPVGWPGCE